MPTPITKHFPFIFEIKLTAFENFDEVKTHINKHWKELAPRFYELHREHFASQGLFNYIIHKFNMVKELPPTFHLSNHSGGNSKNPKHWWPGISAELRPGIPMDLRYREHPSEECEKILFDQPHFVYVNERYPKGEHEKILFNHHHWKHSPGF